MLWITVEMKIKEGCVKQFLEVCEWVRPHVLAEKGCLHYVHTRPVSHEDLKTALDPEVITMVECWDSEDSFKAHGQRAHMKQFAEEVKALRDSVSVTVHKPVFE